jgi:hypothetical protein
MHDTDTHCVLANLGRRSIIGMPPRSHSLDDLLLAMSLAAASSDGLSGERNDISGEKNLNDI